MIDFHDDPWFYYKKCTAEDDDILFPDKKNKKNYEEAREILCMKCPVRIQCLEEAFRIEESTPDLRYGLWGSLTPDERKDWHSIWKNTDAETVLTFMNRGYT